MDLFEQRFAEAMRGSVLPMDTVMRYVGEVPGKRLRPRLVLLSARLFGPVNESTRRTALFVELLHTATLIHDDVVDVSDSRRGQPSVNARWNNATAVLSGDYLLSKAMLLLSDPSDSPILQEMLRTAMSMSEGELFQNGFPQGEAGGGTVEAYLDIIERKTARLIRACCVGGALSVQASEEALQKIADFGLHLGLVFQMRDDLLDQDNPSITALAERLLPDYLDRTLQSLNALAPAAKDPAVLDSLRELTLFCAQRNQ